MNISLNHNEFSLSLKIRIHYSPVADRLIIIQRDNRSLERRSSQNKETLDLNLGILTPNICFHLIYICCSGIKVFFFLLLTTLSIAEHALHIHSFRVFPVAITA